MADVSIQKSRKIRRSCRFGDRICHIRLVSCPPWALIPQARRLSEALSTGEAPRRAPRTEGKIGPTSRWSARGAREGSDMGAMGAIGAMRAIGAIGATGAVGTVEATESALEARPSCRVCGNDSIYSDEVSGPVPMQLSECRRCHHRWTRTLVVVPRLARPRVRRSRPRIAAMRLRLTDADTSSCESVQEVAIAEDSAQSERAAMTNDETTGRAVAMRREVALAS